MLKMYEKSNPPEPPPPDSEINPCRVFLIEDDEDDRRLAERALKDCEYIKEIVPFRDGKEFMDYMEAEGFVDHSVMLFSPILLLVDLEMPGKDGVEVIREIKSDPFLESIPVVVVTATHSSEKIRQAIQLGVKGVFQKPISREGLEKFFQDTWIWPPEDLWR